MEESAGMTSSPVPPAEIVVDLAAVRHNVATLRDLVGTDGAALMVVVKADGYGHGMVEVGRAARQGGAQWLGVATVAEALALRAAGDQGRVLCWLATPGEDFAAAVAAGIDLTASSAEQLAEIAAAARSLGRPASVQLKVDTGLSRGGVPLADWAAVVAAARAGEQDGHWQVTGIWSHLACSDEPAHPANDLQQQRFSAALAVAEAAGLRPQVRHLANSAAAILRPAARYDLVRCGLAAYGLDPAPGRTPDLGLRPAMTVRARLALVKEIAADEGVSYGLQWRASRATTLGLVPVGYADGVPRHASNTAEVWLAGARRPVRGLVCMDQFVVDLGDPGGGSTVRPGAEVVLFGPGREGEPTAQDWAGWSGTNAYEIVTRVGGRMSRSYRGRIEEGAGA